MSTPYHYSTDRTRNVSGFILYYPLVGGVVGVWVVLPVIYANSAPDKAPRQRPRRGIDAQSVKTATQGQAIGYDASKRVKGRKRHLLVDSQGPILQCKVTAAHISDADGLKVLLRAYFLLGIQRLKAVWDDAGYRGETIYAWVADLKQTHKIRLEVSEKPREGFTLLKRRWVVERAFAWFGNYRIHAKEYEVLTDNCQAFTYIVIIHLLLKRKTEA